MEEPYDEVVSRMNANVHKLGAICNAAFVQRDAALAELDALKKRVADARTIEATETWNRQSGACRLFTKKELPLGTYALLRLEDGEK